MGTLRDKSGKFADRIVRLHTYLRTNKKEFTMSNQILRSGTSIGANVAEATKTGSTKDFISKLTIAAKECSETEYWLERLNIGKYITEKQFESIYNDCCEIGKMLTASLKTAKLRTQETES